MIELSRKDFSKAVAAVLLANLPELGSVEPVNGADTIDVLVDLVKRGKRGFPLAGMPESNPDPKDDSEALLASLHNAARDMTSAQVFLGRIKPPKLDGDDPLRPLIVEELSSKLGTLQAWLRTFTLKVDNLIGPRKAALR